MGAERRVFERESVTIRFIYSLDAGNTLSDGDWKEAETIDIGPVLVGGMAFYCDDEVEIGTHVRIALFMDMELKKVWEREQEVFPVIYHGSICRLENENGRKKVAVLFRGFEREPDL